MMLAVLTVVLETAGCIGLGVAVLRVLGLLESLDHRERLAWGFAIGYGVLGWVLFFFGVAGMFSPPVLAGALFLGTFGLVALLGVPHGSPVRPQNKSWGLLDGALLTALTVALVFDLLEGLAPPADADSLAYHFALPKQFLKLGGLEFIPRAVDGATPLLAQMTYIPALALGGEQALTLWTMVSGWGAGFLLYTLCRCYLDRRWSLAAVAILLSTPAIVFGGGSGQIEARNAMFAVLAAVAVAEAVRTGDWRYAVVAGLGVGFFMAAKYIGLLFAAACGLAILRQRKWFSLGLTLTVTALLTGSQWYYWNWLHTGDPVFPVLYGVLEYNGAAYWSEAQHAAFRYQMTADELAVPISFFWLLAYPVVATFNGYHAFESARTGFGPFIFLVLPFALAGLWRFRDCLKGHPLVTIGLVTLLFYGLWFLTGSSQRIRHLVPVLPLLLLCVFVVAARWAEAAERTRPFAIAVLLTLGLQLAGHGLFSLSAGTHFFKGGSREAYLHRNVHSYGIVPWVNKYLSQQDLLYTRMRQLNYLLEVPYFYAHHADEGQIDITPGATDPKRFLAQIGDIGITHLLVYSEPDEPAASPKGHNLWRPLLAKGCLKIVKEMPVRAVRSRTLQSSSNISVIVLKLQNNDCLN